MARTALLLCAWAAVGAALETTKHCHFDGAWGDVCAYTDVCFAGSPNALIIITDAPASFHVSRGPMPVFAATKLPRLMTALPNPDRFLPMYYKMTDHPIYVSPAEFDAQGGLGRGEVWVDETTWIPSFFEELTNIWYFATRMLPVWTGGVYGEMWGLPRPRQILVPATRHRIRHSWYACACVRFVLRGRGGTNRGRLEVAGYIAIGPPISWHGGHVCLCEH